MIRSLWMAEPCLLFRCVIRRLWQLHLPFSPEPPLFVVQGKPTRRDGVFNMIGEPELPFLAIRWFLYDAPWPVWKRDLVALEYNVMHEVGRLQVPLYCLYRAG